MLTTTPINPYPNQPDSDQPQKKNKRLPHGRRKSKSEDLSILAHAQGQMRSHLEPGIKRGEEPHHPHGQQRQQQQQHSYIDNFHTHPFTDPTRPHSAHASSSHHNPGSGPGWPSWPSHLASTLAPFPPSSLLASDLEVSSEEDRDGEQTVMQSIETDGPADSESVPNTHQTTRSGPHTPSPSTTMPKGHAPAYAHAHPIAHTLPVTLPDLSTSTSTRMTTLSRLDPRTHPHLTAPDPSNTNHARDTEEQDSDNDPGAQRWDDPQSQRGSWNGYVRYKESWVRRAGLKRATETEGEDLRTAGREGSGKGKRGRV